MANGDRYVAVGGDCHFGSFSVTRSGFVIGKGNLPAGYKDWEQVEAVIWNSGMMGLRIAKIVTATDIVAAEREKMRAEIMKEMEAEAKAKAEVAIPEGVGLIPKDVGIIPEGAGLVPIEPLALPDAVVEAEEAEKQAKIREEQDKAEAEADAARKQKNTEIREKRKAAAEKKAEKAAKAATGNKSKK